jgi:hypothetical protein
MKKHTIIERIAEKLRIIPNLHKDGEVPVARLTEEGKLTGFPPMEQWDNWTENEAKSWPRVDKRDLYHRAHHLLQLRVGLRPDGLY